MTGWLLMPWNAQGAWVPSSGSTTWFDTAAAPVWDDPNNPENQPTGPADTDDADNDRLPNWFEEWLGTDKYDPDHDNDSATDGDELIEMGTSPFTWDTNGNGLSDWDDYQAANYQPPPDADGDGLTDEEESTYGSDPNVSDTDGDGLSDGLEVHPPIEPTNAWVVPATSPTDADSDDDGQSDLEEFLLITQPTADQDGDGLTNQDESNRGTRILNADTDGDGLSDGFEVNQPFLQNLPGESTQYLSPTNADSDADGWDDGEEYLAVAEPDGDYDQDGLGNRDEILSGTRVRHADTDADGLPDGWEVNGTNGTSDIYSSATNPDSDADGTLDGDDPDSFSQAPPEDPDNDGDGVLASIEAQLGLSDGDAYSNGHNVSDWIVHYRANLQGSDTTDGDGDGLGALFESWLGTSDSDPLESWFSHYYQPYASLFDSSQGDTDGLGLELETRLGSSDNMDDTDGDGLWDEDEWAAGSPLTDPDADQDGLWDGAERDYGTAWNDPDTDDDLLSDYEEVAVFTGHSLSPTAPDSDGDGQPDFAEVPLTDSDGGGIPDRLEEFFGLNSGDPSDEAGDLDSDGATNVEEYLSGWHITDGLTQFDADGDGMTNVWELAHGLDMHDPTDAWDDPDGDFLFNVEEFSAGKDPNSSLTPGSEGVQVTLPDGGTRTAANDYEAVNGHSLSLGLTRDNGPLSDREHDDDWDGNGTSNLEQPGADRQETAQPPTEDQGGPTETPTENPTETPTEDQNTDSDGDGLTDAVEAQFGSDPQNPDTDGGGASDSTEYGRTPRTNPNNPDDDPETQTEGQTEDQATEDQEGEWEIDEDSIKAKGAWRYEANLNVAGWVVSGINNFAATFDEKDLTIDWYLDVTFDWVNSATGERKPGTGVRGSHKDGSIGMPQPLIVQGFNGTPGAGKFIWDLLKKSATAAGKAAMDGVGAARDALIESSRPDADSVGGYWREHSNPPE